MPLRAPAFRVLVTLTLLAVGAGLMPSAAAQDGPAVGSRSAGPPTDDRADPTWKDDVQPKLLRAWDDGRHPALYIDVAARADLSGASAIRDWKARGEYVVDQLRETARNSQQDVRALLNEAGASFDPYWAANTVLVRGSTPALAQELVGLPGVRHLYAAPHIDAPELTPAVQAAQATAVEWGIASIKADRVWSDFGDTGEGITVANVDTGVQYDHPALVGSYRGNNHDGTFTHAYNWFDPAGVCGPISNGPCDNQGHGTHTMGTMVGSDVGGTAIGVAPGATWIAAKGCPAVGQEGCTLDALISSGQWLLAPTDANGQNPRPDLRPQVINNSWGADTGPFTDPFYAEVLDAWDAAGIFTTFSNGNDGGHGCNTAGSPADNLGAYSVGAYDDLNHIAAFSSRGPGVNGEVRPHIAAPGVAVRSSVPGGYALYNGTSMAAPHVSGTVALMWSAAPSLVGDVVGTRDLLGQTAIDTADLTCGGTPENNNVFGEGRLDALAAVDASPVGQTGTLVGVVTDAATGEPIPDATVHATSPEYERTTTTDDAGRYVLALTTGTYDVAVSAYGYDSATSTGAIVAEDEETTLDVGLDALPSVTVSGTVTDGSGQGWPLYAAVRIAGYPHGPIFTDPATGEYQVELPADTTYSVEVTTPYDGYIHATQDVTVGSEPASADFQLTADTDDCIAPGYRSAHRGLFESFDARSLPDGWTRETTVGDGWEFGDPGGRTNRTGGSGGFASIDSAAGARLEDGWLVSPTTDLSATTTPVVSFRTDSILSRGITEVDLSTDDGASWQNIWSRGTGVSGPSLQQVDVPSAAGDPDTRVRFHYRNDLSGNGWWQLDDVLLGERYCDPLDGGLVVGQVTDDQTGLAVDGATVTSQSVPSESATTVPTPDDEALGGGLYWLFSSHTGDTELRAEYVLGQYAPATTTVDVAPQAATRADFALGTGDLRVDVDGIDGSAGLGQRTQVELTLTNVGTGPATYALAERSTSLTAAQRATLAEPGAPLHRTHVTDDGGPLRAEKTDAATPAGPRPEDARWERLHDMTIARTDGLAGVHDGKLYYLGGGSGTAQRNMIYDIAEDRWDLTNGFAPVRNKAAGGFIGDRMYVAGGWGPVSETTDTTLIYDPATDSWSNGAKMPTGVAAAGYAILDDRLYVIGGRTATSPNQGSTAVQVYDPATDTWSSAADYPEPASWQSCGAIDGLIYCAGGQAPDVQHSLRAYVYHPEIDRWFRIADLPRTVTFAATAAPEGLLMVSGGQVGGFRSNEGFYYDPAAEAWASLPNSIFDVYRLAGTCGFYKLGGTQGQPGTFPWVERLPGFGRCDQSAGDRVPWLSVDTGSGSLEPGESTTVTVTLDAAGLPEEQPGEYAAGLLVHEDTPRSLPAVPVTFDVTAPSNWGQVTGVVTGLDRCDRPGAPLAGAQVTVERADGTTGVVETDAEGAYRYWMPQQAQPVGVSAAMDGWRTATRKVLVRAGQTANAAFSLRRDEPCASVDPTEISVRVASGDERAVRTTVRNDGAVALDYTVDESAEILAAHPAAGVGPDSADAWTQVPGVPLGRGGYATAQCPGDPDSIYVVGGFEERLEYDRRVYRYDAAGGTWHELARVPASAEGAVAACEDGTIHVLGGGGTDRHFAYDIARDMWTELAPVPRGVTGAAAAGWDGRIYLAGGNTDGDQFGTSNQVHVYDIATDTWSDGPAMPVATAWPGAVQAGRYLYLVGGLDESRTEPILDVTQRLDLATGTWTQGPSLAAPRAQLGLAATDTALYALGGLAPGQFGRDWSTSVQWLPLADWTGGSWTLDSLPALPTQTILNAAGACTEGRSGGEIWSIGGASGALHDAEYLSTPGESCPSIVGDVPWLSITSGGGDGTVEPDATEQFVVHIDATALEAGRTYRATLILTTSDPGVPSIRVPVAVRVP